ncbi:hypothetical protein BCR35DRAFT_207824 [Leucosporidium creatinivorum]|uniref:Uncharacterized protein n=1 Tax=Leucosporidium creatinivorum TaxID=106004 RepID=A0A1Y2FXZ3_9BASI|nr:hypothetical protein BCR35DRAFT_207824 [Leucosporidium creatinivorum]
MNSSRRLGKLKSTSPEDVSLFPQPRRIFDALFDEGAASSAAHQFSPHTGNLDFSTRSTGMAQQHPTSDFTTTNDQQQVLAPLPPTPIPIPSPLRRHSDESQRHQLPRSPPLRTHSYSYTPHASPWSSIERDELEDEQEELLLLADAHRLEDPWASADKENDGQTESENIPHDKLRMSSVTSSYALVPSRSTSSFAFNFGDDLDEVDEPLYSTFASLHDPTLCAATRRLASPLEAPRRSPLAEDRRGRELALLPRTDSMMSFRAGGTSRSTSRGSVREMSPDAWTARMIKHVKVDPSCELQAESASSPPLDRGSSPSHSSPRHSPPQRSRHKKTPSTASELLSSHQQSPSAPTPSFSRRHSDQGFHHSHSPTEPSSSQTALAKYLTLGRRESFTPTSSSTPTSPISPTEDHAKRGRSSTKLDLAHFASDSYFHLRHGVSVVGSSLRRASHITSPPRPSPPLAWEEVSAIKVQFRVAQEGLSGVNSFLLGLREMETGGASRTWDPRGLESAGVGEMGEKLTRPRLVKWPAVSSTYGEPASVSVEFHNGARKVFSPEGMPPAEVNCL